MRVAHVINTAEIGGGVRHLHQLIPGLARAGFSSVVLVGEDGAGRAWLAEAGAEVHALGRLGPPAPLALASRLRSIRPALLHLHGSRAGLLGALASRLAGIRPVLYTAHMFSFHRQGPKLLRWMATGAERVTCALADRVICVSRADRDAAAARGIDTRRFEVAPNGVEASTFAARDDRREELGFARDAPVVGMVARLVPQKDPLSFVHMAARVAAARPEARFLVVGDGPLRSRVEAEGAALIRDGRLRLAGWRADVAELIATMDVAVFPSLWEAQGIALLEAMAAGRAVVASRLPSHAEVLGEGESGLLVPPADPARLAQAVESLLGDPERRRALGRGARERVAREFTVARMVEETVRIYRSALGR